MTFMYENSRYESLSINRAPFFDGSDYLYWKTRMMVLLKSESFDVWEIVDEGPFVPTKMVDGRKVEKAKEEWSETEKKLVSFNHKAMLSLFFALSRDQFNKSNNAKMLMKFDTHLK